MPRDHKFLIGRNYMKHDAARLVKGKTAHIRLGYHIID